MESRHPSPVAVGNNKEEQAYRAVALGLALPEGRGQEHRQV